MGDDLIDSEKTVLPLWSYANELFLNLDLKI